MATAREGDVEDLERPVCRRLVRLERRRRRVVARLTDRVLPVGVQVVGGDGRRAVLAELVEREVEVRHRASLQLAVVLRDES
jgi:hypothetical protein